MSTLEFYTQTLWSFKLVSIFLLWNWIQRSSLAITTVCSKRIIVFQMIIIVCDNIFKKLWTWNSWTQVIKTQHTLNNKIERNASDDDAKIQCASYKQIKETKRADSVRIPLGTNTRLQNRPSHSDEKKRQSNILVRVRIYAGLYTESVGWCSNIELHVLDWMKAVVAYFSCGEKQPHENSYVWA